MQTELQLFNPGRLNPTVLKQPSVKEKDAVLTPYNPQKSLEVGLNSLIPTYEEENKLQKARRVLGEISFEVTDEQLEIFITGIQFLLDGLLDNFEKSMFDGLTLKQILEGG
jgi:hypothetical protein